MEPEPEFSSGRFPGNLLGGKTNEVKRERWCIVDNDGGLSAADGQLKDERVQPIIGVALIALSTGNYNVMCICALCLWPSWLGCRMNANLVSCAGIGHCTKITEACWE